MKVLLVGATGILGSGLQQHFQKLDLELISASRTSGDFNVDLKSDDSVRKLFNDIGKIDAIVSAIGKVHFGELATMTADEFNIGLQDKLLGQIRLALIGKDYLHDKGSITLTTGIIGSEPIALGVNATAVNVAIEGFVKAAALEMPNGIRNSSPRD
ncbi:short chain dehydrogenase [Vitreoscilla stercoraria]|uniref:Short chain dehydrogenase n=1 Tax=Vitreoscilla stercoraria TaxID=61 RepID=A0ABY4EJU0_VITST|nr:short chain dehydrogenase [Vitreoscilla stercoraria]UOO93612.1 short chain dehydrogenase [Vitreoscilla stercoraria]